MKNIISMKKKYQKPSMVVVELETSTTLLAGSENYPPKNYDKIYFTDEYCDPA